MTTTAQGLPFFERILATLDAAEAAGGDRRGTMSAGILILDQRAIAGYGDWAIDLRVDESDNPLAELRRIWDARNAGGAASGLNGLINSGNYEEAFRRIDASLALDPGRDAAYLQQAQVYLAMGDTTAAIASLARAIELNPKQYFQILR